MHNKHFHSARAIKRKSDHIPILSAKIYKPTFYAIRDDDISSLHPMIGFGFGVGEVFRGIRRPKIKFYECGIMTDKITAPRLEINSRTGYVSCFISSKDTDAYPFHVTAKYVDDKEISKSFSLEFKQDVQGDFRPFLTEIAGMLFKQ